MNLAEKIKNNKDKLERIKRKNEYLKIIQKPYDFCRKLPCLLH